MITLSSDSTDEPTVANPARFAFKFLTIEIVWDFVSRKFGSMSKI
jgi:hypothetical protein